MNNQKKSKNQGSPWILLVFLVIFLINRLADSHGRVSIPVLFAIAVIGIVILATIIGKSRKKHQEEIKGKSAEARPQPKVELHRPVPSMQRREPVTVKRDFSKPEAYCVTCEASGEDHFVRDRQRRIAQLDDWLKNGLIDRQEYLVLKRRFQNDQ